VRLSISVRRPAAWIVVGAAFGLAACSPRDSAPAKTPLPTRETTIDPVAKKLDAASKDIELRRQAIDAQK
jgi:hypothetical protein